MSLNYYICMTFLTYLKLFFVGLVVLMVLDGLWLTFVMGPIFKKDLGHLMKPVNLYVALLVWSLMVIGLMVFVKPDSLSEAFIYGALFGFLMYAVYDGTNYATLKDWTVKVAVIDIVWGTFVCGATSTAIGWISKFL
jgi:uncharacterized membrane protein